jgi:hypothetical protein
MRLSLAKLCVAFLVLTLVCAPIAHAWAMAQMEDTASTAASGDCQGCDMDHAGSPAMCTAMCGAMGPVVLSVGSIVAADAAAEYFLAAAPIGAGRAPPPEAHPPKTHRAS